MSFSKRSPPVTIALSRSATSDSFLENFALFSLRTHESDESSFPGRMDHFQERRRRESGVALRRFLRELGGGVGLVSEVRLQRVLEFAQRRHQGLQREITRSVGRVHAGYVLKLAWLADVALSRQDDLLLHGFLLLLSRRR